LYDARSDLPYCTSAFRDCNSRFLCLLQLTLII